MFDVSEFTALLIPIGVGVVLPVSIVAIFYRSVNRRIDKQAEVVSKAIENGTQIDPAVLADFGTQSQKRGKTIREKLFAKFQIAMVLMLVGTAILTIYIADSRESFFLLAGCILFAVGLGFLISFFMGKSFMKPEIDAEEMRNLADAASESESIKE